MTDTSDQLSFCERTRQMALRVPRNVQQKDIAKGANVSDAWLSRFIRCEFKNPSINQVEQLHNYLLIILGE